MNSASHFSVHFYFADTEAYKLSLLKSLLQVSHMSVVCFVLINCLLHDMFQLCSVFIYDVIVCMRDRSHLKNLAALGPGWHQIMEFSKPWVVSIFWYQTALQTS
jgi:hypothetical protein